MGADLVSYSIVMPEKGVGKFVTKEISRIAKALGKIDDNGIPSDCDKWDYIIKKLDIPNGDYDNDLCEMDADMLLEAIRKDLELVEGFDEKFGARDMSWQNSTIGGKKVVFMFAGEMSWGDSPEGLGYETLRALWRLGIARKIEDRLR